MRILVTGGAGFIGSNLSRMLLADDRFTEIRVIDDLSTGRLENLAGLDVEFIEGTILNEDLVRSSARQVDAIAHLGAIPSVPRSIADPRRTHEANTTGTLNVLEAARAESVKQVIVASSSSVYGSNPALPKNEDDWTRPLSPYAVSKLATEGYALAYGASYGMNTLAFRFFNVYGPGQAANHAYAAVIPKFIDAIMSGRPVEIHGDGEQSRDFTYVATVCQVIQQALLSQAESASPINLAFGTNTTLLELLDVLETVIGRQFARTHVEPRVGDVRASQASGSLVKAQFPDVSPVPLLTGVAETYEWYQRTRHHV